MKLLKYEADRIPVAIFFSITLLDFAVYFTVGSTLLIVLYFLAMIPVKGLVSAWNHHHQHVPMFHARALNRLLELSFALQTGASTHAWTLHHVHGHHKNYLDQEKDESRWRRLSGEPYGYVAYTAITALTAYPRALTVGRNHPRLRRAFIGYGLLTLAIIVTLVAMNPVNGVFIFVLAPIVSLTITVAATFHHHAGLDTDDHMAASHNYIGGLRNVLTGNLGYHTAHHYRQGMHWSKLPELHESLSHKISDDFIRASPHARTGSTKSVSS